MPTRDSKTPKNAPSDSQASPNDRALRDDWNKLSPEDQDTYFSSLSAEDQVKFAHRVGLFDSKEQINVSAPPKADWREILSGSPAGTAMGVAASIPWMKEKAYSILNFGANQLPTVGGVAGGVVGGVVGGVINPAGGEVPGAIIGSGIGGGAGEAGRETVEHLEGRDKYDDPDTKTWGYRAREITKQAAGQAAAEATGTLFGKLLRPTLERSLTKLYYAGGLKYGDPLGPGDLETVINDLLDTEKQIKKPAERGGLGYKGVTTVGDFLSLITKWKKDIGQQVDLQAALPITQNGKQVMLGKAEADSTPIVDAINSKLTADPSIVKIASLNKAGKEAAYLESIKKESLMFQKTPWTYTELTDRRIKLNQELAPLYNLPAGEQRVYLLEHPDLAFKKAEADAIRDVVYPKMDILSGNPIGTTAALQNKRGALMSLENQVNHHLGTLKTTARQRQGAPLTEKANISSYGTSSGKPGFAIHRLSSLIHTPNPERSADRKVAQAFGNKVGTKIRKVISTPLGSKKFGDEILSLPLRELVNPSEPKKPDEDDSTPGPQSLVATPKDLIDRAKQLNHAAQGQVAYNHIAVNPQTNHRIGSSDGTNWFDLQTGTKVA